MMDIFDCRYWNSHYKTGQGCVIKDHFVFINAGDQAMLLCDLWRFNLLTHESLEINITLPTYLFDH